MSNLTYNPNVNIPPYNNNKYEKYDNYMEQPNINLGRSYDSQPSLQQIDPRNEYRNERLENSYNYQEPKYTRPIKNKRKYDNNDDVDVDKFQDITSKKFDWMLIVKKIAIYTALFLLMSSVRIDDLVCNFIPFLKESQLLCMTVKGIILSLIIIFIQTLL